MAILDDIQKLLAAFRRTHAHELTEIPATSDKLRVACDRIQDSWSSSFAGWHGKMYFRDFQTPSIHERFSGEWGGINGIPDGWQERSPEEVTARIEKIVGNGFSAKTFENRTGAIRKEAEGLQREVSIVLAAVDTDGASVKDKQLVEKIETFEFGRTKGEFIHDGLPGTMMSRDMEAMRQGTYVPSWLYYEAVALEGKAVCAAIDDFINLSDRLARQLQMGASSGQPAAENKPLSTLHSEIHAKCRQLYETGAYAEAAEKGFKVVRDRLRKLTGRETGSEAFGKGSLHIKGAIAPHVDDDFNEAVKFLTMAIDRFRNEKSHTSDARIDDPIRAYEYLRLSSLAMNLLDNAEIKP